jgi:Ca2+-binding RTX toxin-like protein
VKRLAAATATLFALALTAPGAQAVPTVTPCATGVVNVTVDTVVVTISNPAANTVSVTGLGDTVCAGADAPLTTINVNDPTGVANNVTFVGGPDALTVTATLNAGIDVWSTTGTEAVDVNGGPGDDTLRGDGGSDTLTGGADNDTLQGAAGADTLNGGNGDDALQGGAGADALDGGAQAAAGDTADYSERATDVTAAVATGGEDTFTSIENLTGGGGDDTLIGDALANDLAGGAGDDVLRPGAGSGTNTGGTNGTPTGANGAAGDTVSYQDVGVGVVADIRTGAGGSATGTGIAQSLTQIENLTGGGGDDTLVGDAGANDLSGGGGDDLLRPGAGAGANAGGANGATGDRVSFEDLGAGVGVVVDIRTGLVPGTATGTGVAQTLTGIENLTGGPGADTLIGADGDNAFAGGAANDTVSYADRVAGEDIVASLTADSGGQTGTAEADTYAADVENLTGGAGSDTLVGDGGANDLAGGDGDDLLRPAEGGGTAAGDGSGATGDRVSFEDLGAGVGVVVDIRTGLVPGTATGTGVAQNLTGIENLTGGPAADTLIGDDATNAFAGGGGSDTVSYVDRVAGEDVVASLAAGSGGQAATAEADTFAADIENLTGGAGNDTLVGDAGANDLSGGGGDDLLRPGAGAGANTGDGSGATGDRVSFEDLGAGVGVVVDIRTGLVPGTATGAGVTQTLTGIENLTGGPAADTLIGDDATNAFAGGGGSDTVSYVDRVAGEAVVAALTGTGGQTGTAEADTYAADVESLTGGAGDDTLSGNALANVLDGAGGTDTVTYGDKGAAQPVTVTLDGAANDGETGGAEGDNAIAENLTGGAGADTLTGDAGPNVLRGAAGTDSVNGGAGADTILGEGDAGDSLDGGPDIDLLTYENATQAIVVNLSGVPLTPAATDTATNLENVTGGTLGDRITGDTLPNVLTGGPGDDTVTYGDRAAGVAVTLDGAANDGAAGESDNVLAENVVGGGGPDTFTGDLGPNVLDGAGGVDTVTYADRGAGQAVTVRLDAVANDGDNGGEGDNVLAENITGGAGADTLTGNVQANVLDGAGGVDTVTYADKGPLQAVKVTLDALANDGETAGAEGDDVLAENVTGGAGPDTLIGNTSPNVLRGAGGLDTVAYLDRLAPVSVTITLDGTANDGAVGENDTIGADVENAIGGGGDDTIVGDAGPNVLDGSAGADRLRGAADTDAIRGGDGADTLFGEADAGDVVDGGSDGARDVLTYDGESSVVVNLSRSSAAPAGTDDVTNVEDVIGGNGDDVITGDALANALSGGPGTDEVTYLDRAAQPVDVALDGIANDGAAGEGDNVASMENITGGGGGDRLEGNQADNVLSGLGGDDTLVGRGGSDRLDGGADGFDTASYEDRQPAEGVAVTLNGSGGGNGETDTLANFERLLGGDGDDQLTGSPGNDVIAGALGADIVDGDDGNDTLDGGDGPDSLFGGAGSDELAGGDGRDRLDGGADADGFSAGAGDDDVMAFDGTSENIVCGDGTDRVDHDLADTFSAGDCEQRTLLGFVPPAFVLDPRARDRDRDGVFAGTDCNDFDASIHPGAPDIPGDAIDQDCNSADAPFPALTTEFRWAFAKAPLGTRVKLLALRKVPAGAKIEVSCRSARSPRCVFATRTRSVSSRSASVSVRGYFGDRPLSRGATIEVRVSAPRTIGRFISFTMRKDRNSPAPRRGCLAPNTTDVIACP